MTRVIRPILLGAILILALLLGLAVTATDAAPMLTGEDGSRDVITPTSIAVTGITQTLGAASGDGQKFSNTGDDFILVTNAYTAGVTITVVTGGTVGGIAIEDVDVFVDNGRTKLIGPFNKSIFDQPNDTGKVYINWSAAVTGTAASSVTLAVYRLQ